MRRLTVLLVLVVAAGSFLAFRPTMTTVTAVEGVWKTDSPQPSILLFTAGHYAAVRVSGTEPRETFPEEPTDEQRLAAWSRFFANAGTYELHGNEIHMKVIVHKNPNITAEQAERSSTFEVDGDTMVRTLGNGLVLRYTRIE
jgi:hypothetical protein